MALVWTIELVDRLKSLHQEGKLSTEIVRVLKDEFGFQTTPHRVDSKLYKIRNGDVATPANIWVAHPRLTERLRELAEEGLSTTQIASALSQEFGVEISRGAVAGRKNRLGLSTAKCISRSPVVNLISKRAAKQERRSGKVVPFRTKVFSGPSLDLTFDQLTRDTCKFERSRSDIVSEFRFCGQPVKPGKPYCEHCCQIAYVAVQRRAA